MKIWKVNYCSGDGCTWWGTECVSIHKSEEGAALAIDKHKETMSTTYPGSKQYELNEYCEFQIEPASLED